MQIYAYVPSEKVSTYDSVQCYLSDGGGVGMGVGEEGGCCGWGGGWVGRVVVKGYYVLHDVFWE